MNLRLKSVAGLLSMAFATVGTAAIKPVRCEDESTFRALQIQIAETETGVEVKLRSNEMEFFARRLGVTVPEKAMPVWGELAFSPTDCQQKAASLVTVCRANTEMQFVSYESNQVYGKAEGKIEVILDTFTRDTLSPPLHNHLDRVEAKIEFTSDAVYQASTSVEMAKRFCEPSPTQK